MQYIFRYNLRMERVAEYHRWLAEHTGAASQRAGWTYLGTWFDFAGSAPYHFESRWELNEHGSLRSRPLEPEVEAQASVHLSFVRDAQVSLIKTLTGLAVGMGATP